MPAVEQCQNRSDVHLNDHGEETARCGLLPLIVNAGQELSSFRVPRAACQACVEGVPPAVDRLNPVLSSFVYSAAAEIVAQGGTSNCNADRATELQQWARTFFEVEVTHSHSHPTRPRSSRDCCHLGQIVGYQQQSSILGLTRTAVHNCHHPEHNVTTESACRSCRDWSRADSAQPVRLAEILPRPSSWTGSGALQWAVGMTTAPRRIPTLETSLDYLRRAGWSDVRLAVDGAASMPPAILVDEISLRSPAVGAWPNFYLTLLELVMSDPDADAILMIQDDAVFHDRENMREYLDAILWPSEPQGIVSLYCSAAYTRETPGWAVADERWEWGALAFVFPANLARQFVCDARVLQHRWTDRGLRFIDDVVGEWAERNAIPVWYPSPSLVQHIGDTSTVWPGVAAEGYRRADSFVGDL